ncbi:hypothetical protein, partial, partial [Parasitella parasitica]
MFSSDNNLTEEQAEVLNNFLSQFHALRESIPAQLEAFSNNLSTVEANMHEKLQLEINHVLAQAEAAIKSLGEEIKDFIDNHVVLKRDERPVQTTEVPSPTTNITSAHPPPMIKVKEPNVFTGKPSQCHSFFSQLTLVFASNP